VLVEWLANAIMGECPRAGWLSPGLRAKVYPSTSFAAQLVLFVDFCQESCVNRDYALPSSATGFAIPRTHMALLLTALATCQTHFEPDPIRGLRSCAENLRRIDDMAADVQRALYLPKRQHGASSRAAWFEKWRLNEIQRGQALKRSFARTAIAECFGQAGARALHRTESTPAKARIRRQPCGITPPR
jgi:hypothetical protein